MALCHIKEQEVWGGRSSSIMFLGHRHTSMLLVQMLQNSDLGLRCTAQVTQNQRICKLSSHIPFKNLKDKKRSVSNVAEHYQEHFQHHSSLLDGFFFSRTETSQKLLKIHVLKLHQVQPSDTHMHFQWLQILHTSQISIKEIYFYSAKIHRYVSLSHHYIPSFYSALLLKIPIFKKMATNKANLLHFGKHNNKLRTGKTGHPSGSKSYAAERNFCLACLKFSFVAKHFIVTFKCQLFKSQKCASPATQETTNRLEMKVLTANEMKSKPSKLLLTSLISLQKDPNPDLTTFLPVPTILFLINLY